MTETKMSFIEKYIDFPTVTGGRLEGDVDFTVRSERQILGATVALQGYELYLDKNEDVWLSGIKIYIHDVNVHENTCSGKITYRIWDPERNPGHDDFKGGAWIVCIAEVTNN